MPSVSLHSRRKSLGLAHDDLGLPAGIFPSFLPYHGADDGEVLSGQAGEDGAARRGGYIGNAVRISSMDVDQNQDAPDAVAPRPDIGVRMGCNGNGRGSRYMDLLHYGIGSCLTCR